MKNILKILPLLFVFILSGFSPVLAENLELYKDSKKGFQILYPADWQKKENDPNYSVVFQNKSGTAVYGIVIKSSKKILPARNYLEAIEKETQIANIAEVRSVTASELKLIGADDSSLGVYKLDDKKYPVYIFYSVFTKSNSIYILIQTILSAEAKNYVQVLDKMSNSFKIIKRKQN